MNVSLIVMGFFIVTGVIGVYTKRLMDEEDQEELEKEKKGKKLSVKECVTPGCYHGTVSVTDEEGKKCYWCENNEDMC